MKKYSVYFVFFCLAITKITYPALTNQAEKHAALKESLSRARESGKTPPTPTQTNSSMARVFTDEESGILSLVSPSRGYGEDDGIAHRSPEDEQGMSTTSRASQYHFRRRTSQPSQPMSPEALHLSVSSGESFPIALPEARQPATPQQKLRAAVERARSRRSSVTFTTLPRAEDLALGFGPRPMPKGQPLARKQTLVPSSQTHDGPFQSDSDDYVLEVHRTSEAGAQTDPTSNITAYLAVGSAGAASGLITAWAVMSSLRPQRRMFTGFEASAVMLAGEKTTKLFGITAVIVAATVAAGKFNNWLHAACRSREKLLEMKFENALRDGMMAHRQETVKHITNVTTQVTTEIENHKKETREVIGHLVDAVSHAADLLAPQPTAPDISTSAANSQEAAKILHAATDQAKADVAAQATHSTQITPPPLPQEKAKCGGCCCVQ